MASGSSQSSQQTSQQQSQSGTYFQDPAFIQRMLDALGGQMGQFNDYLSNPAASPLYTNQLRGLMASLAPQEAAGRQAYTDAGIAAGNRSSGRFAQGQANLEGNIMRNQQATAGQLLGQNFGQMTQALLAAMGLTPQMLNALKMQQSSSSGSSQGTSQGSSWNDGGGGGGGGGSSGGSQSLKAPNLGYTPGVGLPQSYGGTPGTTGPNAGQTGAPATTYNPNFMEGATWFGPNGSYITPGTGQPGAWTPPQTDEWGFTAEDWANDEYYN
jgi:hypothetical protein